MYSMLMYLLAYTVIAASNRRKQQLSGKSVSTRKRKRPIEDTTSIDIPCDTDQLKDQIDSQRKQKNKSRYILFVGNA